MKMKEPRTIFAAILVDDDAAKEEDLGTIDYFVRESGWMEESGIRVGDCVLADADSDDQWERYIRYLLEWVFANSEAKEGWVYSAIPCKKNPGRSPMRFEEFCESEKEGLE